MAATAASVAAMSNTVDDIGKEGSVQVQFSSGPPAPLVSLFRTNTLLFELLELTFRPTYHNISWGDTTSPHTRHDHTRRCHCLKESLASTVNECRVIGNSGCEGAVMAQTCTRLCTRMMPTSSEDCAHASKVYQHQQHAAPPARTERSKMNQGPARARASHGTKKWRL